MALDRDGLHIGDEGSITTYTGKRVNPIAIDPALVDIKDIARALSRQCRYNGHVGGFLSVARHSIWVSESLPDHLKLSGLLHDAAEAYLGDLVRPLKHTAFGEAYLTAEVQAEKAIASAYGTPFPTPPEVMEADRRTLMDREINVERWAYHGDPDRDEQDFLAAFLHLVAGVPVTTNLVGISGYAQAGKDTVGAMLRKDAGFERLAFADALKQMAYALNPTVLIPSGSQSDWRPQPVSLVDLVDREGWTSAKINASVRELLQRLGTEAGRKVLGGDIWVRTAMAKVEPGGRYVFTDVRFPNEAKAIKDAGGQVWRVERAGTAPVNAHPSETALDDWPFDVVIHNDFSLAALSKQVEIALLSGQVV